MNKNSDNIQKVFHSISELQTGIYQDKDGDFWGAWRNENGVGLKNITNGWTPRVSAFGFTAGYKQQLKGIQTHFPFIRIGDYHDDRSGKDEKVIRSYQRKMSRISILKKFCQWVGIKR